MQQRIIAILLLVIFTYNLVSYYFTFIAQQHQIKNEVAIKIMNNIPENELTVFSFHPESKEFNKIEWIDDMEFRYNGQLYDVVNQLTNTDGTIHYYCLNDIEEEDLLNNLDKHIQNHVSNNGSSKKSNNDTSKKMVDDYIFQYIGFSFASSFKIISYQYLHSGFNNRAEDVPTPPPSKNGLINL